MNTLAPLDAGLAEERVLGWQTKLHRWAAQDEQQRFGDLFNLVCDPATLLVAWERVKRNRGSKTAKLVLEPIFEADFCPTSYGFRPGRRAQDAIEQVRFFIHAPRSYEWVIEGDVENCFGSIHHGLLMEQVRCRVTDKRVLALIRQFLGAGIMTQLGTLTDTPSGTPQGGLCAAAHKPPYEQWWVMRSAGL